jgi:hypothetical protein
VVNNKPQTTNLKPQTTNLKQQTSNNKLLLVTIHPRHRKHPVHLLQLAHEFGEVMGIVHENH